MPPSLLTATPGDGRCCPHSAGRKTKAEESLCLSSRRGRIPAAILCSHRCPPHAAVLILRRVKERGTRGQWSWRSPGHSVAVKGPCGREGFRARLEDGRAGAGLRLLLGGQRYARKRSDLGAKAGGRDAGLGSCGRWRWKQLPGKPQGSASRPRECPAGDSLGPRRPACLLCSPAQPTEPRESCPGPPHLFPANGLQTPRRRVGER